jgi:hypothetical protein
MAKVPSTMRDTEGESARERSQQTSTSSTVVGRNVKTTARNIMAVRRNTRNTK